MKFTQAATASPECPQAHGSFLWLDMAMGEAQLEEAVEVTLQRRRLRSRNHRTAASETVNAGGPKSQSDEDGEEDKGALDMDDHFDEYNGARHTDGHPGIKHRNIEHSNSQTGVQDEKSDNPTKGFDVQKSLSSGTTTRDDGIVNDEITPSSNLLSYDEAEQTTRFAPPNGGRRLLDANAAKGSDQDIELDLERFLEDPEAYDIFCPNCNCCVKKVILRKRKQESSPSQHTESVDVFECPSCFSFLILAGQQFVSLFVPKKGATVGVPDAPSLVNSVGDGPSEVPKAGITTIGVLGPKKPSEAKVNGSGIQDDDAKGNDTALRPSDAPHAVQPGHILLDPSPKIFDLPVQPRDGTFAVDVPTGRPVHGEDPSVSTTKGPGELNDMMINIGDAAEPVEPGVRISGARASRQEPILEPQGAEGWDILKSIVYGGLIESVTSLGVVTSAVGANADTVNILALGLANLIGGLFVLGHQLWDLKRDGFRRTSSHPNEEVYQYNELLGRRENFLRHATVAVLSFLIFGMVPVVTYAFSFHKGDVRELKLAAAMAASLFCISILAIGKAHIQKPHKLSKYVKTVLSYACTGVAVSGVSYIAGSLLMKLMEKLGWFKSSELTIMPLAEPKLLKQA